MARRRSKSYSKPRAGAVSLSLPLTPRLHALPQMVSRSIKRPSLDLRIVDDRRRFHPNPFIRPAVSVVRRADTKLVVSPIRRQTKVLRLPDKVAFAVPRNIALCVRRKVRKEVIFATSGGGAGKRRPRRNQFSDVRC